MVFFCFLATVVLCRDTFFVACFFWFRTDISHPKALLTILFSFSSGGDMSVSWRVEKNVFVLFPIHFYYK